MSGTLERLGRMKLINCEECGTKSLEKNLKDGLCSKCILKKVDQLVQCIDCNKEYPKDELRDKKRKLCSDCFEKRKINDQKRKDKKSKASAQRKAEIDAIKIENEELKQRLSSIEEKTVDVIQTKELTAKVADLQKRLSSFTKSDHGEISKQIHQLSTKIDQAISVSKDPIAATTTEKVSQSYTPPVFGTAKELTAKNIEEMAIDVEIMSSPGCLRAFKTLCHNYLQNNKSLSRQELIDEKIIPKNSLQTTFLVYFIKRDFIKYKRIKTKVPKHQSYSLVDKTKAGDYNYYRPTELGLTVYHKIQEYFSLLNCLKRMKYQSFFPDRLRAYEIIWEHYNNLGKGISKTELVEAASEKFSHNIYRNLRFRGLIISESKNIPKEQYEVPQNVRLYRPRYIEITPDSLQSRDKLVRWTKYETQFLLQNIDDLSLGEMQIELQKTEQQISSKISSMNLKTPGTYMKAWTEKDLKYLQDNWYDRDMEDLQTELNRSVPSIKRKAYDIGLKSIYRLRKEWTPEEDKKLVDNWEDMSLDDIIKKTGRLRSSVRSRARKLGLLKSSTTYKHWSPEDVQFLKDNWKGNLTLKDFQEKLNRSVKSIFNKANRLKLHYYHDKTHRWDIESIGWVRSHLNNIHEVPFNEIRINTHKSICAVWTKVQLLTKHDNQKEGQL